MKKTVLKASAGTGKTYRLSLEYISALLRGFEPQDILVMTFTRKATSEIRERILQFLGEIITEGEKGKELINNLLAIEPNLNMDLEKVKEIYEKILASKDSLKIFTIDGFINLIFKSAIAPYRQITSYQIVEDSENRELLAKVLNKIAENKKDFTAFKNFFIENIEKSWEKYIEALKPLFAERWKFTLLKESKSFQERVPFETSPVVEDFELLLDNVRELCRLKGKDPTTDMLFKKEYLNYPFNSPYEERETFLLSKTKSFIDENYFWKFRKCKKCEEEFEDAVESYYDFCKNLARVYFNKNILTYERDVLQLVEKIYSFYDEIKFTEKRFTHGDISSYTFSHFQDKNLNLKDKDGLTPYFFSLIESQARIVFIDEFQDTSILQWKILKNLIDKAEEVICVGDEKQSIYGWRGGEKRLFENLEKILQTEEKNLDRCFRSQKRVIDFTNDLFTKISERDSWKFTPVQGSESKSKGYIHLITAPEEKEERELFDGVDEIVQLLSQNMQGNYSDVAILARTGKQLNLIGEKLTEAGIPYILESNETLMEHRAVHPLFLLLKYFHYDNFLYLLEFLRSEVVEIDDSLLKKVIQHRENLSEVEEISELFEKISYFKERFIKERCSLSQIVFEFLKSFGVLDIFNKNSDLKNLYAFYDLLGKYKSLDEFFRELEKNPDLAKFKQVSSEENNMVTLMTIHKSKGLEFKKVIYYHCPTNKPNNLKQASFTLKMDSGYEDIENYLISCESHRKVLKFLEEEFPFILERESANREEEINNIYVALTRAIDDLYIIGDGRDSFVETLDTFHFTTSGELEIPQKDEEEEEEGFLNTSLDFSYPTFSEEEESENVYETSFETEFKRMRGLAVHYYMENILYGEKEEFEKAYPLTMSKFGSELGEQTLKEILEGESLKKFFADNSHIFSKEWDLVYSEYPIYSDNQLNRLDRMMIKKPTEHSMGKILIVDYKTGSHEESQLERYKNAIEKQLEREGVYEKYNVFTEFLKIDF